MIKSILISTFVFAGVAFGIRGNVQRADALPKSWTLCDSISYCLEESANSCGMTPAQQQTMALYYIDHC